MAKVVRCRDAGADCDFEARAETEEELFQLVTEHAKAEHGMEELPPEMVEKVRSLIREE
ncbi:MAG: DUF1059 domain-containing protein [bacterium]